MKPSPASLAATVQVATAGYSIPLGATVFSAVQPTGRFHLGNYLGAIRNWKQLAESAPADALVFYATADLHAITVPQAADTLRQNRHQAIASILALGIDPDRCLVFHQLAVPQHAELAWMLMCHTGMGYLNRMTQWKAKADVSDTSTAAELQRSFDKASTGLFTYPVLQAADILLYKLTHVPVGDDQLQHLELTRHLAEQFNKRFGQQFPLPNTVFTPMKKVLLLRNPAKKMSKLDPDQNLCIYVNNLPEEIRAKLKKAVTDSIQGPPTYDPEARPGVLNLINIVAGLTNASAEQVVADMAHFENHKQLKDHVGDVVIEHLREPRELYTQLIQDPVYLEDVTNKGVLKARAVAETTMKEVKQKMGFD